MPKIFLIHRRPEEVEAQIETLRHAGNEITVDPVQDPEALRRLWENPPDALIVDLSRMPSHGRDVAVAVRERKSTRHIPIVFVGGDLAKVQGVQTLLPDATYTTWKRIRNSVKHALAHPPESPVVPKTRLDGYSGTPLPKKLGIKANATVALLAAPKGFQETLRDLPSGVRFRRDLRSSPDLILLFVRSRQGLERRLGAIRTRVGSGGLWIVWPKKASCLQTDLTQNDVRRTGLASGLVDYKICAVDADWSGLKFAVRKTKDK